VTLLPHDGRPLAPADLWGAWSHNPAILGGLLALALLYWLGGRERRRRAARRRDWRVVTFWLGWGSLALALVSPLHALGEVLFWAHMTQHEILMTLAAPLLVLGGTMVPILRALPRRGRRAIGRMVRLTTVRTFWRTLTRMDVAWIIQAAVLTGWHLPALYQWSLASEGVHALQHTSFLGAAALYWWSVLETPAARRHRGAGVLSLFLTSLYSGALGALITFAATPWYPAYRSTVAWGLTPMEDQQFAGLVMWMPGGVAYLVAALALTARWLGDAERRVDRRWPAPVDA
jgi:cytochrome c oxidase assembly factor CtaG